MGKNKIRLPGLLLFAAVSLRSVPAEAQTLLLRDARIVDPATQEIYHGSILIADGKIQRLWREAPPEAQDEVVDLNGKWVVPGLNDLHVHAYGNLAPGGQMQLLMPTGVMKHLLYAGVTGFLDLFSEENQIFALRDRQRREGLPGADLYCAGPILTCTGGHGTEYGVPTRTIDSPEEARRVVTDLAKRHPDVVKLVYDHATTRFPTMDRATLAAALETARQHGLKTVVHIGTWPDVEDAVQAGATAVTHLPHADVPDDLVTLLRQRGAYVIPTLTVQAELAHIVQNPALLENPLLKTLATPAILDAYRDTRAFDPRTKEWLQWQMKHREGFYRNLKKLADGGVKLLAGTDAGNYGTFQGFSLHRELELLVEAGLTPWQALASATTTAGEFLGQPLGVQPGSVANLLVLNASPIEDIRNTQDMALVVHRGQIVDRDALLRPPAKPWTHRLLDDFSDSTVSACGRPWRRSLDSVVGSNSTLNTRYEDGQLRVWGTLKPAPGRPAFAQLVLEFDDLGTPFDVTAYEGVRVRIRVVKGPLLLQLLTTGVTNFDYHAVTLPVQPDMQTLELPFAQFRQLWSPPVKWTGKDVRGVVLSASGFAPVEYEFVVDRLEFYGGSEARSK